MLHPSQMNAGGGLFNRGHPPPHGGLLDDPIFGGLANTYINTGPGQRPMPNHHHPMFAPSAPAPNNINNGYMQHEAMTNKGPFHPATGQQHQWGNGMRGNGQTFGPTAVKSGNLFPPFGTGGDKAQPQQQQQQYGLLGLQNFNPSVGYSSSTASNQALSYGNNNNTNHQLNAIGAPPGLGKITGGGAAQKMNELRNLMDNNANRGGNNNQAAPSSYDLPNRNNNHNNPWGTQQTGQQHGGGNLYNGGGPINKGSSGGILNLASVPPPSNNPYGGLDGGAGIGRSNSLIRAPPGGPPGSMLPDNTNSDLASTNGPFNQIGLDAADYNRSFQHQQQQQHQQPLDDNHFNFPTLTNNNNNNYSNKIVGNAVAKSRFGGQYRANGSGGFEDNNDHFDEGERSSSVSGRSGAGLGGAPPPSNYSAYMADQQGPAAPSHYNHQQGGNSSKLQEAQPSAAWQNKYNNGNNNQQSDHQMFGSNETGSSAKDVNGTSLWASAMSGGYGDDNGDTPHCLPGTNNAQADRFLTGTAGSDESNNGRGDHKERAPSKDSLLYDEEFIKKVVNATTGWGKVPIKQDAAWEHHGESPEPDACTIGTQIWKGTDAPNMPGGLERMMSAGPQSLLSSSGGGSGAQQQSYGMMWKGDNEINQWQGENSSTGLALNSPGAVASNNSMMLREKEHNPFPLLGGGHNGADTWNLANNGANAQPWSHSEFSKGSSSTSSIHNNNANNNGAAASNQSLSGGARGNNSHFGMAKSFSDGTPLGGENTGDRNLGYSAQQQQQQQQQGSNNNPNASNVYRSGLGLGAGGDDWQTQARHGQNSALINAAFKAVGSIIGSGGAGSPSATALDEDVSAAPATRSYHNNNMMIGGLPCNNNNLNMGNNGNASGYNNTNNNNGSRRYLESCTTASSKLEDEEDEEDGGGIGVWKSVEAAKQESSMYWNSNMVNNMEPGESLSVLGPANPPPPPQQQPASASLQPLFPPPPSYHHPQQQGAPRPTSPPRAGYKSSVAAAGWGEYDPRDGGSAAKEIPILADHSTVCGGGGGQGQATTGAPTNYDDGTSIWAQNTGVQLPNQPPPTSLLQRKSEKSAFGATAWSNEGVKEPSIQSHMNAWINNAKDPSSDFNKNLWSTDAAAGNNNHALDTLHSLRDNLSSAGQGKSGGMNINGQWPPQNANSLKSSDLQMLGLIKEDIETLLTKNKTYHHQYDSLDNTINNNNNNNNTSTLEMLNGGSVSLGGVGGKHTPAGLPSHNKEQAAMRNSFQSMGGDQQLKPYYDMGDPSNPLDYSKTDAHMLQMMGKANVANSQLNARNFSRQQQQQQLSSEACMGGNQGQYLSSLNMPSINASINPQNALNSKMLQLQKNISPAQILSNSNHQTNNNATNYINNGGGNPSGPAPPQHNTSLINQQLDQLNMAISSGLINPHILNLKLSPQILVMLQQLLSYHKILQTMQVQQQTLANKKGLNLQLQRQQLEHLQTKIDQVRHQILQLQNNIAIATQPNVPPATGGNGSSPPTSNTNEHDGGDANETFAGAGGIESGGSSNIDPVSPTYQKSRLQQWKLPSPEKREGGDGTTSTNNNSVTSTPTNNSGSQQPPLTTNTANSDVGVVKASMHTNASSSKASVSSETSSKSELNIAEFEPGKPWSGFKNVENDPYITPGSLASRNQMTLNALKDSEVFNSLDSSTLPSSSLMGSLSDEVASSHITDPSSSASSSLYAAFNSAMGQGDDRTNDFWPAINNANINNGESNENSNFSMTTPSCYSNGGGNVQFAADSIYRPQTSAPYRPPPSGMNTINNNNRNNLQYPLNNNPGGINIRSGSGSSLSSPPSNANVSSLMGAAGGANSKFGWPQSQEAAWKGYPSEHSAFNSVYGANKMDKATWLVLKNLTSQVDGSTLKTLCQQHGPVQHFYLNRSTGSACALYGTRDEATRAERSLHSVVLWNAPLQATTAPYDAFPLNPLPPTNLPPQQQRYQ